MRLSLGWKLAVLMAFHGITYAQAVDNQSNTPQALPTSSPAVSSFSPQKFTPIGVTQTGSDRKPSRDYYHQGVRLENFQQFMDVIGPLNDSEATGLLKTSGDKETAGKVLYILGGLLCASGIVYEVVAPPTTQTSGGYLFSITTTNPPDQTPMWILGGLGAGVAIIGLVLENDAGQGREDAVKRYNHLIGADQSLSLNTFPHASLPGLEWTRRF